MWLKALSDIVEHAILLAGGLYVVMELKHLHPYFGIWHEIVFATTASAVGSFIGIALSDRLEPLEVAWDQEGLTIRVGTKTTQLPWSEYRGYRSMWEYPPRLKIRRDGQRPIKLDLFAFAADDRRLLLTELTARHPALLETHRKLASFVL